MSLCVVWYHYPDVIPAANSQCVNSVNNIKDKKNALHSDIDLFCMRIINSDYNFVNFTFTSIHTNNSKVN